MKVLISDFDTAEQTGLADVLVAQGIPNVNEELRAARRRRVPRGKALTRPFADRATCGSPVSAAKKETESGSGRRSFSASTTTSAQNRFAL
ncbi:hypothetical protein AB0L33_33050 [Streptomyces sp. NPDC052299]|uniref:hypothetical protein n=1 Tax=Streptomyces sp. NPDC052299 TaxID=3155054 RepID=UPI0034409E31